MVADIIFSDLFLPVWAQPFLMRAGLLIFTLNVQRATVSPVSGSQRLQDLKTRLFSMRSYLYDTRLQLASVIFMGLLHFFINFALTVNNGPLSEEPCSIHPSVYVVAGAYLVFFIDCQKVLCASLWRVLHFHPRRLRRLRLQHQRHLPHQEGACGGPCGHDPDADHVGFQYEHAHTATLIIIKSHFLSSATEILIQYNIIFVLAEIFFADIICVLVPLLMTFRPYWVQFNNGLADARPMSAVMDSTFNDMRLHEKTVTINHNIIYYGDLPCCHQDDSSSAYSFGHDGEIVKLDADGGEHQIRAGDTATDSPQDEHKSSHARKDALKPKPSLQQCDIDESATLIDYLRDPVFLAEFTSFCVRAFCAESISFFLDMQRKQQIKKMDQEARAKEVKYLFETYIEVGAPKELNITDVARKELTATYQKVISRVFFFTFSY